MSIWDTYDLRQVIPDGGARKDYSGYSVDRCPFHEDSHPSLIIHPHHWECKAGCGSGDVVEWVCKTRGVGRREAISFLRDGLPDQTERKWTPKPKLVHKEELDQSLGLKYHIQLQEREREWYRWRGLTDESINRFELGYGAPPGGGAEHFTIPITSAGQLVNVKFRVDDRCPRCLSPWSFPTEEADGEVCCADCKHRWILTGPKYKGIVGHSEPRLFNADALKEAKRVFIAEGEFDAIRLSQENCVAVSSTGGAGAFPVSFAVHFLHVPVVYLCYDSDNGGEEGAKKVSEVVPKARIVRLPLGHKGDVSDYLNSHTREEFDTLVRITDSNPGNCVLLKVSNGLMHGGKT